MAPLWSTGEWGPSPPAQRALLCLASEFLFHFASVVVKIERILVKLLKLVKVNSYFESKSASSEH